MSLPSFLSALLALLLAPGPTNTLMAISGAGRGGLPRVLRLMPAELAGYLTTIVPLTLLGTELFAALPGFAMALKLAAAIWVFYLALKLWRATDAGEEQAEITGLRVYITTVLNPKALIIALVLLPAWHDPAFLPRLGLLCLIVGAAALIWGAAGALLPALSSHQSNDHSNRHSNRRSKQIGDRIGNAQIGDARIDGADAAPLRVRGFANLQTLYRLASAWLALVAMSLLLSVIRS